MKINGKFKVLVFAGSTRKESLNRKLAALAVAQLRDAGLEVTFADLADYPMPLYDGDAEALQGLPDNARRFKELARDHHALAIASPEYNGSFPALVKNTIDWISRPVAGEPMLAVFRGKPAALLSTSPGPGAGKRGLKHLRELLQMIGMTVLDAEVAIPKAFAAFDADGQLARPEDQAALNLLIHQLQQAATTSAVAA